MIEKFLQADRRLLFGNQSTHLVLVSLCAMIISSGCRLKSDPPTESDVLIANGIEVPPEQYPSVVLLRVGDGICTGTFVSDYQLLTAAHCLENTTKVEIVEQQKWSMLLGLKTVATATRWISHPLYKNQESVPYDLGLVEFPKGTAKVFSKIYSGRSTLGETITMVGYGHNEVKSEIVNEELQQKGSNIKRSGQNRINEISDGKIRLISSYSEHHAQVSGYQRGQKAGLASGDSGGPLFNQKGEIIGVASGVDVTTNEKNHILTYISTYCDLSSESSQVFLRYYKLQ